jgi:hypothetical protein
MTAKKGSIAFDFVLEELHELNPVIKPMFGCHALYIGEAIVLITRKKNSHFEDNGVWVATTHEHHESLRNELPLLRNIKLLGGPKSNWQNIPFDADDFEESVLKVCSLIRKRDKRIGKIPKPRKQQKN